MPLDEQAMTCTAVQQLPGWSEAVIFRAAASGISLGLPHP